MSGEKIIPENLEEMFDQGEDVTEYFDFEKAEAFDGKGETKRVNVDFPLWMVDALDREARRVGIGRQAVIKMWLAERLDAEARRTA